jgi:beta-glucosidase
LFESIRRHGCFAGQAGAGAIAEILFGTINPSGKLAETFPRKLEDNPSFSYFPGGPGTVEYRESIYVGYRFYDSVEKEVLFPFGHGLSYTSFEYSNLSLDQEMFIENKPLTVKFGIKNTGNRTGKEIAQIYVKHLNPTAFRPAKELKGFVKIRLEPGEEKQISVTLDQRSFAYFNTGMNDWHVESGDYQILVGASSRDIRLVEEISAESSQPDLTILERDKLAIYRDFPADARIETGIFRELIGRELPPNRSARKGSYTIKTPLEDMSDTLIGRLLMRLAERVLAKRYEDDPDSPNAHMDLSIVKTMPLRSLLAAGGFKINIKALEGVMEIINGRFFKGLRVIIR